MESVEPLIEFILHLRKGLEKGQSLQKMIEIFLQTATKSHFKWELMRVYASLSQGQSLQPLLETTQSRLRRQLWILIQRSREGEPILPFIVALESEALLAFEDCTTNHLQKLPFLMMIPLLFFMFPAFGLLILGPILDIFFHSLQ